MGWKRGVSTKGTFTFVKGKSVNLDQLLFSEEFQGGFIESNKNDDIYNTQREILGILIDSDNYCNDNEYEIIERVQNPFYKNLDLDV
jgi:hypothetical protein